MKKIVLLTVLVVSCVARVQAAQNTTSWQVPGIEFVRNHSTALSTLGAGAVMVAVLETYQLPGKFRTANDISHTVYSTIKDYVTSAYTKVRDFCTSFVSAPEKKTK